MPHKKEITQVISILKQTSKLSMLSQFKKQDPFYILIATILSQRTTDLVSIKATKKLFSVYKTPKQFAEAPIEKIESLIKTTGTYRNKAKNIKKSCRLLVEKFNSQVPETMEELLELPGVARKTANIVLSNAYGVIEGIAVDTHVRRLSKRLGLTENKNPDKIERDLMEIVPQAQWKRITDLLIFHGRNVCVARKPKCELCTLNKLCPSAFTFD